MHVVKVPELGEGIKEVYVTKILVKKGDVVIKGVTPILEVQADKAIFEIIAEW